MSPVEPLSVMRIDARARVPERMSAAAAGIDLAACLGGDEEIVRIAPGARAAVPTGIAVAIPVGFEGQVRPRSGLARDFGVTVLNAPGTIDADYRGELVVLLINLGPDAFDVRHHQRIAQLVVAPVAMCHVSVVDALPPTQRGARGFGSTGT
ncbi:MAG: dUTP diphosphatase [Myxococcales bacterium FL481]|nr:MAG: dUTP diphosphatase [Myxococcales bacterium FL481]